MTRALPFDFDGVVVDTEVSTFEAWRETYRLALTTLRVEAQEALASEDSPAGVAAARRADLRCVAVPNDVTRTAAFADATVVIPSLARYSLAEILAPAGD